MNSDDPDARRAEGAQMIKSFCAEAARELGTEVVYLDWATEPEASREEYVLTVQLRGESEEPPTIAIQFSPRELEDYPGRAGTQTTDRKILDRLRELLE